MPTVSAMPLFGALAILAHGSAMAPFLYALL
jgi:hypothetical protein